MLLKACNKCGNLIPYGQVYCDKCRDIVDRERELREVQSRRRANKRYNSKRDPKEGAFYRGKAWRLLAHKRIQADGYKCVKCGEFATEVDHIIPIQTPEGWDKRYEWDNLQSLCKNCHNEKHNRFTRRGGGPRSSSRKK